MITDLHRQLAALNRGRWVPGNRAPTDFDAASLADLVEGVEAANTEGVHFAREDRLRDLYTDGAALARTFGEAMADMPEKPERGLAPLVGTSPEQVVWVDLETTGLHGRPLFLVGIMTWEDGDLVVRQYFARDYSEERAVLWAAREALGRARVVVTFNGRSFDLPYLRDRMTYHRLPMAQDFADVDLLHPCRRRWRRRLPNCRLQTLETYLCRRRRVGDIPGFLIPQRYHEYVHSKDPKLVGPIFHHNRLDLVAMAELLVALLAPPDQGEEEDA